MLGCVCAHVCMHACRKCVYGYLHISFFLNFNWDVNMVPKMSGYIRSVFLRCTLHRGT